MGLPENIPEKRRYPRLRVCIEVKGRWRELDGKPRPLQANLVLLSEGGAQLHCKDQLIPANSTVEFELHLPKLKVIETKGCVRWWRKMDGVHAVGIEFSSPIRRIGQYVEKELAAAEAQPQPQSSHG